MLILFAFASIQVSITYISCLVSFNYIMMFVMAIYVTNDYKTADT